MNYLRSRLRLLSAAPFRIENHALGVRPGSRPFCLCLLTLALVSFALVVATPAHGAISESEELGQFGSEGSGAAQFISAFGVATDPATGFVYVADPGNHRIDEFTPWGGFVKAFGKDVAPGGVNEQQEVRVRAGAGEFELSFESETTSDLPFDASGEEVEAALDGLASLGAGGVAVEARKPGTQGATPEIYIVTFRGASVKERNVPQLVASDGAVPLSGGAPSTSLISRPRAEGGAATTGFETCTAESGCQAGAEGSGPGEESSPLGVAVDSAGDVYVVENKVDVFEADKNNKRVQKFGPGGAFMLMFGGGVDHTTGADVCTAADVEAGDECGTGATGSAPGEFNEGELNLALGPGDAPFVSSKERVQKFDTDGAFEAEFSTPGRTIAHMAIDPTTGKFFVDYVEPVHPEPSNPTEPNVTILGSSGTPVGTVTIPRPKSLAVDPSGDLFAVNVHPEAVPDVVWEFDSTGTPLSPPSCCTAKVIPGRPAGERFEIWALGSGSGGDLYTSSHTAHGGEGAFLTFFGPPPAGFESPPAMPPTITGQSAIGIGSHNASFRARINPHFWTDAKYYVEYGTHPCSQGGCEVKPVPPGEVLGTKVSDAPVATSTIPVEGLEAGTTYFFRFVAQSGGGSVDGPDRHFTTFREEAAGESCPNRAFRSGASAGLPDCRAYEMVSPVEKFGGNVGGLLTSLSYPSELFQSSPAGEEIAYSAVKPFAGSESGSLVTDYLATRQSAGWESAALSAAHGASFYTGPNALDNEFKAFTPDLCEAWLVREAEPQLAPGAVANYPNLYTRDNCGSDAGTYHALTTTAPPNVAPGDYFPEPQGASSDGSDVLFRVEAKLTPEALGGISQLYLSSGGQLHLVCILPSGVPSTQACTAGSGDGNSGVINRVSHVRNAISTDGSRVYWTARGPEPNQAGQGLGQLYLRTNPARPQSPMSGHTCTEPEMACTVAVSQAGAAARFWSATPDGGQALYLIEDPASTLDESLYLYDATAGSRQRIATRVAGVVAASEDLSSIYFVSRAVLAGTSGATAGAPNLYLYSDGAYALIATLSERDLGSLNQESNPIPSDTDPRPLFHVAQSTPDGGALAFISTVDLTGYDSEDAATGEDDSEVYVYSRDSGRLVCASCNPSGGSPEGREFTFRSGGGVLPSAATLPAPLSQFHDPRALSADGRRLFFDSYDALSPADTNGKEDVYEWEESGVGSCSESRAAFSSVNGGCVYLISTGKDGSDSAFVDASANGDHAFFTTSESLLPQDPGFVDLYDAHVKGGYPPPPASVGPCEGEACQPRLEAPSSPPVTSGTPGPGNPKPSKCTTVRQGRKAKHRQHGRKSSRSKRNRCVRKPRKVKKKHGGHHHGTSHRSAGKQGKGGGK